MHLLPVGHNAVLVEVASPAEAVSLATWARNRSLAVDVVPGARTVLLDGIVSNWVDPLTELGVRHGFPEDQARASARLGLAVTRGLLLDLLATGDRKGVDAAMERFVELMYEG